MRNKQPFSPILLATGSFFLLFQIPSFSSEESTFLVTQGLVKMLEGNLPEAESLFQNATAKDPQDTNAFYYYYLSLLYQGKADLLLKDLERRGDFFSEVPLLKGIALYQKGDLNNAEPLLEQYYKKSPTPLSAYYLGTINYIKSQYKRSEWYLLRGEGVGGDMESYRLLYLALTYEALGEKEKKESTLKLLRENYPQSPAYLLYEEMISQEKLSRRKPYQFYGQIAQQWDSNPALIQTNISLASLYHPSITSTPSAFRTTLSVGGKGTYPISRQAYIEGRGDLFGGIHEGKSTFSDYDLLYPSFQVGGGYRTETVSFSLFTEYRVGFLSRKVRRYSQEGSFSLPFLYTFTPSLRGGLEPKITWFSFGAGNERNARSYSLSFLGFYQEGKMSIQGSYTPSFYQTYNSFSPWKNQEHALTVTPYFTVTSSFLTFLLLKTAYRTFPNPFQFIRNNIGVELKRTDLEWNFGVGGVYRFTPLVFGQVLYQGVIQNSTAKEFEYRRHIGSLSVGFQI